MFNKPLQTADDKLLSAGLNCGKETPGTCGVDGTPAMSAAVYSQAIQDPEFIRAVNVIRKYAGPTTVAAAGGGTSNSGQNSAVGTPIGRGSDCSPQQAAYSSSMRSMSYAPMAGNVPQAPTSHYQRPLTQYEDSFDTDMRVRSSSASSGGGDYLPPLPAAFYQDARRFYQPKEAATTYHRRPSMGSAGDGLESYHQDQYALYRERQLLRPGAAADFYYSSVARSRRSNYPAMASTAFLGGSDMLEEAYEDFKYRFPEPVCYSGNGGFAGGFPDTQQMSSYRQVGNGMCDNGIMASAEWLQGGGTLSDSSACKVAAENQPTAAAVSQANIHNQGSACKETSVTSCGESTAAHKESGTANAKVLPQLLSKDSPSLTGPGKAENLGGASKVKDAYSASPLSTLATGTTKKRAVTAASDAETALRQGNANTELRASKERRRTTSCVAEGNSNTKTGEATENERAATATLRVTQKSNGRGVSLGVTSPTRSNGSASKKAVPAVKVEEAVTVDTVPPVAKKRQAGLWDVGAIVWARLSGERWWPAMTIEGYMAQQKAADGSHCWVFWYGDHKVSQILSDKILWFAENFQQKFSSSGGKVYKKAVNEALQECSKRSGCSDQDQQPAPEDAEQLKAWARHLFEQKGVPSIDIATGEISSFVGEYLKLIANRYQSHGTAPVPAGGSGQQVADAEQKTDAYGSCHSAAASTSSNEDATADEHLAPRDKFRSENKELLDDHFDQVRAGKMDIEKVCIACDIHRYPVVAQHPLIVGGLCQHCKGFVMDAFFCYGADGCNVYCLICGNGGELLVCGLPGCGKTYCTGCIGALGNRSLLQSCKDSDPWTCFLCASGPPADQRHNLLVCRPEWQRCVMEMFERPSSVLHKGPSAAHFQKKRIRVLSLFDGISTGKIVLDRLGLDIEVYYASEIDIDSIQVTRMNQGDSVTPLGDIQELTEEKLASLGRIDLLIGGSPCNDLSLVNPARKGLYDGSGVLFFDFYRIILNLIARQPDQHLFWLFENVVAMKTETKASISRFLECEPVNFNAGYFSAQNRARYFWGNIPGMYCPLNPDVLARNITLQSVLTPGFDRQATVNKIRTVTTRSNSLKQGKNEDRHPVIMNGQEDRLWPTELESVFGLPKHYTDVGNLGPTKRQKLLGRAWCVPVVEHLLSPLRQFFLSKEASKN